MAQALFERHGPPDVRAESAGAEPGDRVHPVVVEAMREVGIDLEGRRPKKLTLEMQLHADWGITLACGAKCPYVPSVVEDWDVADPAGHPIEVVRTIRDEVERRVRDLAESRIEQIREDRRQHMMRMGRRCLRWWRSSATGSPTGRSGRSPTTSSTPTRRCRSALS